jgi:hypothetical protein
LFEDFKDAAQGQSVNEHFASPLLQYVQELQRNVYLRLGVVGRRVRCRGSERGANAFELGATSRMSVQSKTEPVVTSSMREANAKRKLMALMERKRRLELQLAQAR